MSAQPPGKGHGTVLVLVMVLFGLLVVAIVTVLLLVYASGPVPGTD